MHGIYFSANNDKEGFRLPINPEKVNVVGSGNGEEYEITKLGSVNIPKNAKLDEFSLQSYFPFNGSPYLTSTFRKPQYYIDVINRWRLNKMHIRYIYVNGSFTINELVTIESFEYDESDSSGDVNFTMSLKKFVPFGPKKMVVVKKPSAKPKVVKKTTPPRQNNKAQPKVYSLIKGDNLWKLAKRFLGSGTRYPEIQKLNGIKDSQLRRLPIGLKVKIPPK